MGDEKMVKVQATAVGHYKDRVREIGEVFEVPASFFDKREKKNAEGKGTGEYYPKPSWFEAVVEREVKSTRFVRAGEAAQQDADDLT